MPRLIGYIVVHHDGVVIKPVRIMLISDFFRIAFYCEEPHLFEIYDGQVAQAAIGSVPLDKCKLIALRAAHKFRIWPIYIGPQSSLYHIPLSASQINDIDMAFSVHLQHICTFIVRHIYQSG